MGFAGTARFSGSCRRRGFGVEPYDWHGAKVRAVVTVARENLLTPAGRAELLVRLGRDPRFVGLLVATPCETGSRARELPMPEQMIATGFVESLPLRSEEEPWGRTFILEKGTDRGRAQLADANVLWRFTIELIRAAHGRGILWVLENPWRSRLWWCPEVRALLELSGARDVLLQHCMFGGAR